VAQNQRNAWELIQRSHAIANGIFVAAANRVGSEGKIKFWGNSFVAGPLGEIVARAGDKREEILMANCDLNKIEETRQSWPFSARSAHRRVWRPSDSLRSIANSPAAKINIHGRTISEFVHPIPVGLLDAGRVGAASRHLAILAA
jgi:hypothetical protein